MPRLPSGFVRMEADQVEPFQRSTTPWRRPASEPPTHSRPRYDVSACRVFTVGADGSVVQVVPFQVRSVGGPAELLAPATRLPFQTVSACTAVGKPLPIGCQTEPLHAARLFTPAPRNVPPAISWPFQTTRARTVPLVPGPSPPSAVQRAPSKTMTFALVDCVPPTRPEPPTTSWVAAGPGPSGSHSTEQLPLPVSSGRGLAEPQTGSHWARAAGTAQQSRTKQAQTKRVMGMATSPAGTTPCARRDARSRRIKRCRRRTRSRPSSMRCGWPPSRRSR